MSYHPTFLGRPNIEEESSCWTGLGLKHLVLYETQNMTKETQGWWTTKPYIRQESQRSIDWSPQFTDLLKEEGMLHGGKQGPVPTSLRHSAAIKSKMSQYLLWNCKMSHFQHSFCFLCSTVNKILVYENFLTITFSLYLYFTVSQFLCDWNCSSCSKSKFPFIAYMDT